MKKGLIILLWLLWFIIPALCTEPGCKNMVLEPDDGRDDFVYPLGDDECPYLWLKSTRGERGYNISFHFQNAPSNQTHTIQDYHWHLGMVQRSVEDAPMITVMVDNEEVARGNSKLTITSTVKVTWILWDNKYTFPNTPRKRNSKGRRYFGLGERPASRLREKDDDDAQEEEGKFGLAMILVLMMLAVVVVMVMVVMVMVIVLCCRMKGSATKGRWVVEREQTVPTSASINPQFNSSSDLYVNTKV